MIGRRVNYQGFQGTIRYEGPIVHEDRGQDIWLGIEWDDVTRGRHNGTVADYVYFTTKDGRSSASLLKKDKIDLGTNILDAIFLKYFKEIPKELHGILDEQIIQELKDQELGNSVIVNSLKQSEEEVKSSDDTMNPKYVTVASQKQVLVEFDQNAFFETGRKKKKMVEFYGFNEIWQKINNLKTLKELSLKDLQISSIGKANFLSIILQNLRYLTCAQARILSLESNLLYSWHQVFLIGKELPHLQELSISLNQLRPLETQIELQEESKEGNPTKMISRPDYRIICLESNKMLELSPVGVFNKLRVLVMINMQLTWKEISEGILELLYLQCYLHS